MKKIIQNILMREEKKLNAKKKIKGRKKKLKTVTCRCLAKSRDGRRMKVGDEVLFIIYIIDTYLNNLWIHVSDARNKYINE